MQARELWHTRAHRASSKIPATRPAAPFAAVGGLLKGRQPWLSGVGRHLPNRVDETHDIERSDRLLGHPASRGERRRVYPRMTRLPSAPGSQPCLIVDWSDIDTCTALFPLRAAVPVGGRTPTVLEAVYPR